MARQAGPFFFTGTIDDVTFYKMGDRYYLKMKSEPTNKRKQKQGGTALQRLKKKQFGEASVLVSDIYWKLPRAKRRHLLHQELTGRAVRMIRVGMSVEAIRKVLMEELLPDVTAMAPERTPKNTAKATSRPAGKGGRLSGWQVTAIGGLQKEWKDKPITTALMLRPKERPCAPCLYTGMVRGEAKNGSG